MRRWGSEAEAEDLSLRLDLVSELDDSWSSIEI